MNGRLSELLPFETIKGQGGLPAKDYYYAGARSAIEAVIAFLDDIAEDKEYFGRIEEAKSVGKSSAELRKWLE